MHARATNVHRFALLPKNVWIFSNKGDEFILHGRKHTRKPQGTSGTAYMWSYEPLPCRIAKG